MSDSICAQGRPVELNVYDLIERNDLLVEVGLGLLHTGVVVDGREYSYGADGGIIASRPKDVIGVKFRETIFMGNTYLSPSQIRDVISNLEVLFTGTNYNMLEHNCNHFSNEFCRIITGKQIPSHINRCATIAGWFTRMASNVVSNVTEFVENLDIPLPHLVDERNREEQEKEKRPKDTNTNPSSK